MKFYILLQNNQGYKSLRDARGQASNLVIYDIKTTDSGKYRCEVSNPAVEVPKSSGVATIEIYPEAETKGAYPPQEVVGNYKVV